MGRPRVDPQIVYPTISKSVMKIEKIERKLGRVLSELKCPMSKEVGRLLLGLAATPNPAKRLR